jgi:hypothetical protein
VHDGELPSDSRGLAVPYVIATPELMKAAATDLAAIGSAVDAAHLVAAGPTTGVTPAAADEVSTGIAALFSQHAQEYQAQATKAAAVQGQFVANLTGSAGAYASAEDAIHAFLVALAQGNSAVGLAIERPLIQFVEGLAEGSGSWIDSVPGPLRPFVIGVPFLSIFAVAIPFFINLEILNAISQALTGQPI